MLSFARRHCFAEILRGFKKPYVFREVEAPGIKIKVQINKIKAYIVIFYIGYLRLHILSVSLLDFFKNLKHINH